MVLGDLEEKAKKYKVMTAWNLCIAHFDLSGCHLWLGRFTNNNQKRLQAVGEIVSDGEDDADDV